MKPSTTITNLSGVLDTDFYAGDDLDAAAARSRLDAYAREQGRATTFDWLPRLVGEAGSTTYRSLRERFCEVTGREATTGEDMTIHFHGNLKVVDLCAEHILGTTDYSVRRAKPPLHRRPDMVVDYHRIRQPFLRRKQRLFLPRRISQYLALGHSWAETLNGLSSKHRKELRRHLRHYRFTPTLCDGPDALRHFYKCAFLPYASFRFGEKASLSGQDAFLMKHRRAVVLWLVVDGVPRGANLLCRNGDTLNIEHCGLTPGSEDMPGLFDCLDYFSLLFAQLTGCRELDFGPSRPHLDNGIFRYKAKWNTRVRRPGRFSSKIRVLVARESEAVRGFLMRNLFVQSLRGKLVVKVLSDGLSSDEQVLDRLLGEFRPAGVDEWLVVQPGQERRTSPRALTDTQTLSRALTDTQRLSRPLTDTQRIRRIGTARAVASYLEA